jgi:hypothetical protein
VNRELVKKIENFREKLLDWLQIYFVSQFVKSNEKI